MAQPGLHSATYMVKRKAAKRGMKRKRKKNTMADRVCATVQCHHSSIRQQECEEMSNQGKHIFLLFSGSVNIGKEKGNVMVTDEGHETSVIKAFHQGLLFLPISGFIRVFTGMNSFDRHHCHVAVFSTILVLLLNVLTHRIYLNLGKEIGWIIEGRAVTSRVMMLVMEISICRDMDISTFREQLAKHGSAKVCRATLDKGLGTTSRN